MKRRRRNSLANRARSLFHYARSYEVHRALADFKAKRISHDCLLLMIFCNFFLLRATESWETKYKRSFWVATARGHEEIKIHRNCSGWKNPSYNKTLSKILSTITCIFSSLFALVYKKESCASSSSCHFYLSGCTSWISRDPRTKNEKLGRKRAKWTRAKKKS